MTPFNTIKAATILWMGRAATTHQHGAALTLDDSIDGGGGIDGIAIDGDYNLVLTATTLRNVEGISLAAGHDYILVSDDDVVAPGQTLEVSALTANKGHTISFDGSAETDGSYYLRGNNVTFTGGAGDDQFQTLKGTNHLYGGSGDDNFSTFTGKGTNFIDGGDGNDDIACLATDEVLAGDGNDHVDVRTSTTSPLQIDLGAGDDDIHMWENVVISEFLQGGGGNSDFLGASKNITLAAADFSAASSGFESISISGWLFGNGDGNHVDLSGFGTTGTLLRAKGQGGNDTITGSFGRVKFYGNGGDDALSGFGTLVGGAGNDTLEGRAPDDKLTGGKGNDLLTGGEGHDTLTGGSGADTYRFLSADDTRIDNHGHHDVIAGFDTVDDVVDLPSAVNAVDTTVASGLLNGRTFNADLAAAVDEEHLAAGDAVVFTPDTGAYAGTTFLVVDLNGIAGYQADEDLVVQLKNAAHLDQLDAGNFG